ncbi:MAG: hypothetical protein H6704_25190 [Myxococcales bacterium]|nr:hypothetical protein [Myxococcales bacterium]
MKPVDIIDTSVLCVWLDVPGMNRCGAGSTAWNTERALAEMDERSAREQGRTMVLPVASIIETGNHIAQVAGGLRWPVIQRFATLLRRVAAADSPWAAFSDQSALWAPERLADLADRWPELAKRGVGVGDATIVAVAEHYANMGFAVRILTGDAELHATAPSPPVTRERRSRRRRR